MSQRFIKPTNVKDVLGVIGYKKPTPPVPSVAPLRLTNVGSVAMNIYLRGNGFTPDLEYNLDGNGWVAGDQAVVQPGKYIEFRGHNESVSQKRFSFNSIANSQWEASGSVMSLIYGDDLNEDNNTVLPSTAANIFEALFVNCTCLLTPPKLPALNVPAQAYHRMFDGCTSLQYAPELPATTLGWGAYWSMFSGCSNMYAAPAILPALNVPSFAYRAMFAYCSKITTAPILPCKEPSAQAYDELFYGCALLDSITTGQSRWFDGLQMTYPDWVGGVAATGTFYYTDDALNVSIFDTDHIPVGWSVVKLPEL